MKLTKYILENAAEIILTLFVTLIVIVLLMFIGGFLIISIEVIKEII